MPCSHLGSEKAKKKGREQPLPSASTTAKYQQWELLCGFVCAFHVVLRLLFYSELISRLPPINYASITHQGECMELIIVLIREEK